MIDFTRFKNKIEIFYLYAILFENKVKEIKTLKLFEIEFYFIDIWLSNDILHKKIYRSLSRLVVHC